MIPDFKGAYEPAEAPEFEGNYYRHLDKAQEWQGGFAEEVLDPDLPIIDAHHHLQEDKNGRHLLHEFLDEVYGSGHNVVATVHVQAKSMLRAEGPAAFKDVGETEFARGVAAMSGSGQYGKTRVCEAIVGGIDFRLHQDVPAVLDAHEEAAGGRFRGIRQISPHAEGEVARSMPLQVQKHLLLDPDFRKGFAELGPRGLSFDAWLFHPQLGDVIDLAKAFPETTIILNHLGGRLGIGQYASQFEEVWKEWSASLKELARLPNVCIKVGGLGMLYGGFAFHTHERAPTSQQLAAAWGPFVLQGIETFGPDRAMMESNFPVDKQSGSYGAMWNAMKRITAGFSPTERASLFHGTAQRVYRMRPV